MIFISKKLVKQNGELEGKLASANEEIALLKEQLEKGNQKIAELESENKLLKESGEKYLQTAKEQSDFILEKAKERYELEINRLRLFVTRWISSLPEPKELTPESRKRRALAVALSEILKDNPCTDDIEQGVELLEKLSNAISGGGNGDSGFNLEEVLNPGSDLDLATLCKELGVMD